MPGTAAPVDAAAELARSIVLPRQRFDAVIIAAAQEHLTDAGRFATRLRAVGLGAAAVLPSGEAIDVGGVADLHRAFTVVIRAGASFPDLPDPALLLHVADALELHPARIAVVGAETSVIQAGCRGGFGLVVGLARAGDGWAQLARSGADGVVDSLDALIPHAVAEAAHWQDSGAAVPDSAWWLDYRGLDLAGEGVRETLCTLANGYMATRGAAPEAVAAGPMHYPGTYAAGVFNRGSARVHGHTHDVESLVNLPNWLWLQWRPGDGGWVGPDAAGLCDARQSLDLRTGVLHRRYRYVDATGRATTVISRRLVSMAQPHLAGLQTTFIAENWSGDLHLRASIDGRVCNSQAMEDRLLFHHHLVGEGLGHDNPDVLWLRMRTSQSRVTVGVATRLRILDSDGDLRQRRRVSSRPARPQEDYTLQVRAGQPVRVEKTAALYTSRDAAITEPAAAARHAVTTAGSFTALERDHVQAWASLWNRCRVDIRGGDGRPLLGLHTFHLLATASPHVVDRDAGVGARGLHGEGYRGHVFWDELFVHRVLALHLPEACRALLAYRHRRLDRAREAARTAGYRGAMFPWQSGSDGRDETPGELYNPRSQRWMPDRSARQRHVGLAIAYSAWQYYQATGDREFMLGAGADLILEIARFFADLARLNKVTGRYEITGVMGPDEFHDGYPGRGSPGVDNNAYTNVMTVWLLRRAFEVVDLLRCRHCGELPERIGIDGDELARWADITARMYVPFLADGVIAQFDGYGDLLPFDFAGYAARYPNIGRLDLILAAEGDTPNRYQVGKQADVLMLLYLLSAEELRELLAGLGYAWPAPALRSTVDSYFARMSHGSTLSRIVHAWVHARTDRAASWACLVDALAADLHDTQGGTTREGIHLGAMAGTIDLAERCYLGLETREDALWLNPRLPDQVTRLSTTLSYRGHRLRVTATHTGTTVAASPCDAQPVTIRAGDHVLQISGGQVAALVAHPDGVRLRMVNPRILHIDPDARPVTEVKG